MTARLAVPLVLLALVATACSTPPSDAAPGKDLTPDPARAQPAPESGADVAADPPAPSCRRDRLERAAMVDLTDGDVRTSAVEIAARTHRCAPTVVVAAADGRWSAALAVPVALAVDAPLLIADPRNRAALAGVLDQLAVEHVITVGMHSSGFGRDGTALVATGTDRSQATTRLALSVANHLGARRFLAVSTDDVRARTAAAARADASTALLPVPEDTDLLALVAESLPPDARVQVLASGQNAADLTDRLLGMGVDAEPVDGSMWSDSGSTTWLVDPRQTDVAAAAAVAATGRGEGLLPIDASDLRAGRDDTTRLRAVSPDRAVLVGAVTADAAWQLPVVLNGAALPGGGFKLFEARRLVALSGHPGDERMGALGEQDLDDTVERLRDTAEPYATDGLRVLPTLEIVATIGTASRQATGDYSRRTDPEALRPWIDRAARDDLYVLLDLQPGHSDFLDQAREYEDLLREPHVGLALDPRWRLRPDQRPPDQAGDVEADEVQAVADWLATLTRAHGLPEKLLVVHLSDASMLADRDTIEVPSELAVVAHVAADGSLADRYDRYAAIATATEERWLWGWRSVADEDESDLTPEQVLELDPAPVLVTYQ